MTNIISEIYDFVRSTGIKQVTLARESGVSTATINRACKKKQADMKEGNASAIRAAMRRLTATPTSPPAPGSPEEAADAAARAKRRRGRPRRRPDGTPATGGGAEQGTSGAPGCDAGAA